jgi:hypothetical protein
MSAEALAGLFALGGTALGWMLSEATAWIKSKRRAQMLRRALLTEISDARGALNRTRLIVETAMQLSLYRLLSTVGPIKFSPHIYSTHFAEACLYLTESERISFNSIYYLIDTINKLTDELQIKVNHVARSISANDASAEDAFRELAGTLELIYSNARHALHNINYHLKNQHHLDMFAQDAKTARELDEEIRAGLMKLAEDAKQLGVEGIQSKKYD